MTTKIDLAGEWMLSADSVSVRASVPGDTHSALLASKIIPDPYWGDQELSIQEYGRKDWTYERTFAVTLADMENDSVFLVADKIDTVATVYINNVLVGRTKSAFIGYRFEVKHALVVGLNHVIIKFESPEKAAYAESLKLPYPAPHNISHVQSPHRNLIRKPQCHAGWDWGLCMMVSGIGGNIYLECFSLARIESVRTFQVHHSGAVEVTVLCEVFSPLGGSANLSIQLGDSRNESGIELQPGNNHFERTIRVSNPLLWWPNGYGPQPLYPLDVQVGDSIIHKRIGLRTLEVAHEDDACGHSMTVIVNHVPVFCKGASWIPADGFPQRQTRAVIGDLLDSAVSANMNMIRVWGGGQYESEEFYDLCDAKGLLIWQDFMFACSVYPSTDGFLDLVRLEAEYQVKRLQGHPCLALWCGNNENIGALNWYPESRANRDRYIVDYDRLNEGVLGNAVRTLDPGRLFWPSSPCGGPGDYSDCWHDDRRGDMHYWSVWFESKPFEAVQEVRPRFCSEFGYQSFPSIETISSYASQDQWNLTSPVMEHHQRSDGGNARIIECIARYFRMPGEFKQFIYLSQVLQAMAIKISVEHFRRIRPVCMGAIYWQLNDLWPVCSWSSLEYGGKWKLLHYAAKRFFAPLLVSILQTKDDKIQIWVNQDGGEHVSGEVLVRIIRFTGQIEQAIRLPASIPPNGVAHIHQFPLEQLAVDANRAFLSVELRANGIVSRNEHFFAPYKKCVLEHADISVRVEEIASCFSIIVQSDKPAFWVTLSAGIIRGEFDDNGFLLLPGEPRTIVFTPKEKTSLAIFEQQLSWTHIRETYR
jgi:beta-mannosidase